MNKKRSFDLTSIIKISFVLFLITMFLFPKASLGGAKRGLLLWFNNVLPTLLPFIIVSTLIIRLNITNYISKLLHPFIGKLFRVSENACYPILMGFMSGIPMGAKTSTDLTLAKKITKDEAMFLAVMCNNASPMFILGFIAMSELKINHIKLPFILILYGSAIISSCMYRALSHKWKQKSFLRRNTLSSIELHAQSIDTTNVNHLDLDTSMRRLDFSVIDSSIMDGFQVITKVGGYIILFSILAQVILSFTAIPHAIRMLFVGLCEITTGIDTIASSTISMQMKIVLILTITSFGGLSGLAQTKSVFGESGLSIRTYAKVKLLNTLITLLFSIIYVTIILSI